MSILGPEARAFVQSESERTIPLLGKYVTKVPAQVVSVTGTAPSQKAVVATPDQIAALASGEITEIPRPAMPVYGSVVVDQWVWCLADGAGLHIMGTPGGGDAPGSEVGSPLEYCELTRSSQQGISSDTGTPVQWNEETADPQNWHSNTTNPERITPGVAGVYSVSVYTRWATNTSGIRQVVIQKNGITVGTENTVTAAPLIAGGPQMTCYNLVLSASDYITIQVFQSAGGSLNLLPASNVIVARIR